MKDFNKMMYDFLMDTPLNQIKAINDPHDHSKEFTMGKVVFSSHISRGGTVHLWAELDGSTYRYYDQPTEIQTRYNQIISYLNEQKTIEVEKKFRDYIEAEERINEGA